MPAFIQGTITCDHLGCKRSAPITFMVGGLDGGETHLYPTSMPEGWKHKRSGWFIVESPFLCPEHK